MCPFSGSGASRRRTGTGTLWHPVQQKGLPGRRAGARVLTRDAQLVCVHEVVVAYGAALGDAAAAAAGGGRGWVEGLGSSAGVHAGRPAASLRTLLPALKLAPTPRGGRPAGEGTIARRARAMPRQPSPCSWQTPPDSSLALTRAWWHIQWWHNKPGTHSSGRSRPSMRPVS